MPALLIDNELVHYETVGRAPTWLLFVHGWVGSWRYWFKSMQALANTTKRCYALDLWGYGGTARAQERFSIEGQTDLLESFIQSLGIPHFHLVIGHGLGALASIGLAERHPELVERLMLVSMPLDDTQIQPRLVKESPRDLANWLLKPGAADDGFEEARLEALNSSPDAIRMAMQGFDGVAWRQRMNGLSLPTLRVHGLQDALLPIDGEGGEVRPNQHVVLFEQAGHYPMLQQPSEFSRLAADFVSLPKESSPQELSVKSTWTRRVH